MSEPPKLVSLYASALMRSLRPGRRGTAALTLPSERHHVQGVKASAGELSAFQALMRQPLGEYLPSGYLHVLAFPIAMSVLARPDFPLPLLGMVHLRNRVEHLRPLTQNAVLAVTAWVENLAPHRRGTQVDAVVEIEDGGQTAWRGRSTYLAKGLHPRGQPAAGDGPRQEDLVPDIPTAAWRLDNRTGRRYARVSGDYNPIHLSVPSARLLGLKRPIAHGMYLASRMVAEAGPGSAVPFRWEVDFKTPVTLPAEVYVAVDAETSGMWTGASVIAWDPRRRRTHFTGELAVL